MTWNTDFPRGTVSVKANKTIGQQNTTYIKTTMGGDAEGTNTVTTRDHFWDVDSSLDGRHRFIQSKGFTVGGLGDDPVIGTDMDGVLYLREVNTTIGRFEWFHRNTNGIYQVTPSVITGTVNINSSSYFNVTLLPANTYGEIFMYATTGTNSQNKYRTVKGIFRSNATTTQAWSIPLYVQGNEAKDGAAGLKFANGDDISGLNFRARKSSVTDNLTWNYIITYRAL